MIYFDNSATTAIDPEVIDAMLPYLYEEYGNPSSKYYTLAHNAKTAIDRAREAVADLLGCEPEEIIFTSGSTESNNMVLKGIVDFYFREEFHLITSCVEHPSVLDTARYLEARGCQVRYLPVNPFGRVPLDVLEEAIRTVPPNTASLVSIMWGNNELGSLNDIVQISEICKSKSILLHSDATQVVGKTDTSPIPNGLGFLSLSAHKLHGPKGIGACFIRKHPLGFKTQITPLLHGGGQELGYRSGTLSVHNIVGLGKAAEIAKRDLKNIESHLNHLEKVFVDGLKSQFPGIIQFNSDVEAKIPGIVNIRIDGVVNELIIKGIAGKVAISTGSACSSSKPSHVLQSIGLDITQVRSSFRISFSKHNTVEEIDTFLNILKS